MPTTLRRSLGSVNCPRAVQDGGLFQALFFDVMAVKADQRCSTFALPQCGQRISPSS
jgi:hypothetical protein